MLGSLLLWVIMVKRLWSWEPLFLNNTLQWLIERRGQKWTHPAPCFTDLGNLRTNTKGFLHVQKPFRGQRWTVCMPTIICFRKCAGSVTASLKSRLDFLQEGEQLVKKIGGVFAFKVKDGPGGKEATWVVDVKNGKGSVSNDTGRDLRDWRSFSLHPGLYSSIFCSAVRLKYWNLLKTKTFYSHTSASSAAVCLSTKVQSLLWKSFRKLIMCFSLDLDHFPYFCSS